MYCRIWIFCVACLVGAASSLDSSTLRPGDNKCLEELQTCTDKYSSDDKNESLLHTYHDCVDAIACLKHEDGYNERLQVLADIDGKLESLDANRGDWWNGGVCVEQSFLAKLSCLVVALNMLLASL